jgi:hypothetical protein
VIGTVQASDSNNDELSYTLESTQDILINRTTGELSIGVVSLPIKASASAFVLIEYCTIFNSFVLKNN